MTNYTYGAAAQPAAQASTVQPAQMQIVDVARPMNLAEYHVSFLRGNAITSEPAQRNISTDAFNAVNSWFSLNHQGMNAVLNELLQPHRWDLYRTEVIANIVVFLDRHKNTPLDAGLVDAIARVVIGSGYSTASIRLAVARHFNDGGLSQYIRNQIQQPQLAAIAQEVYKLIEQREAARGTTGVSTGGIHAYTNQPQQQTTSHGSSSPFEDIGMGNANGKPAPATFEQAITQQTHVPSMASMMDGFSNPPQQQVNDNVVVSGPSAADIAAAQEILNRANALNASAVTPAPVATQSPYIGDLIAPTDAASQKEQYQACLNEVGGWAINYTGSGWLPTDYTVFDKFKWESSLGTITDKTKHIPGTYEDFRVLLAARGKELRDARTMFQTENPEITELEVLPAYRKAYISILLKYRERLCSAYHGFMAGSHVLSTRTKAFNNELNISVNDQLDSIMSPEIQNSLADDELLVVNINNREYYLISSEREEINDLMVRRRKVIDTDKSRRPDNRSFKGHYYLINPYILNGGDYGLSTIEDFYDMECDMICAADYNYVPASSGFNDDTDDGEEAIIGAAPRKLLTRTHEETYKNVSPVDVAESLRNHFNSLRDQEFDRAVLLGGSIATTEYVYTPTKRDRAFWSQLQTQIGSGAITDTRSLGDFLVAATYTDELMSPRMRRMIDSKLNKAYNNLFNDVLSYDTVVIERSFIDEHEELQDIIDEKGTSALVRTLYNEAVQRIIRTELVSDEFKLEDDEADYNEHGQFPLESGVVTFQGDTRVAVKKVVHTVKKDTKVIVVPFTTMELGINLYGRINTLACSQLPEELNDLVTDVCNTSMKLPNSRVVLVTADNYELVVTNYGNDLIGGSLAPNR